MMDKNNNEESKDIYPLLKEKIINVNKVSLQPDDFYFSKNEYSNYEKIMKHDSFIKSGKHY
jgi:hypothetical protein